MTDHDFQTIPRGTGRVLTHLGSTPHICRVLGKTPAGVLILQATLQDGRTVKLTRRKASCRRAADDTPVGSLMNLVSEMCESVFGCME